MNPENLDGLLPSLAGILEEAGRTIVMPAWTANAAGRTKDDGSVVTETDTACQRWIADRLAAIMPDIPLLGEEMEPDVQEAKLRESSLLWCLDPLDGTSNFVAGIPFFGLSLALLERGTPMLAVVHDPVRRETFTAVRGRGCRLNERPVGASGPVRLGEAVGFVDFKRLPPRLAARLASVSPWRSQRNLGSCALEWAWLAAGRGAFIIHGGEKIWDFAAGGLLAFEAGAFCGDFEGADLFHPVRLSSPVLAAANAALAAQLKHELSSAPS